MSTTGRPRPGDLLICSALRLSSSRRTRAVTASRRRERSRHAALTPTPCAVALGWQSASTRRVRSARPAPKSQAARAGDDYRRGAPARRSSMCGISADRAFAASRRPRARLATNSATPPTPPPPPPPPPPQEKKGEPPPPPPPQSQKHTTPPPPPPPPPQTKTPPPPPPPPPPPQYRSGGWRLDRAGPADHCPRRSLAYPVIALSPSRASAVAADSTTFCLALRRYRGWRRSKIRAKVHRYQNSGMGFRAVCSRASLRIALYTATNDNIVSDLLTTYLFFFRWPSGVRRRSSGAPRPTGGRGKEGLWRYQEGSAVGAPRG